MILLVFCIKKSFLWKKYILKMTFCYSHVCANTHVKAHSCEALILYKLTNDNKTTLNERSHAIRVEKNW